MKSSLLINLYHVSPSRTTPLSLSGLYLTAARRFLLRDTLHLQIWARYTLLAKYVCPEQLNTADRGPLLLRPKENPRANGKCTSNKCFGISVKVRALEKMRSNLSIEACNANTPEKRGGRGQGEGKKSGGKRRGKSLRRRRNNINLSHMHRSGFVFRWIIGLPWQACRGKPTCSECICNGRRLHASRVALPLPLATSAHAPAADCH